MRDLIQTIWDYAQPWPLVYQRRIKVRIDWEAACYFYEMDTDPAQRDLGLDKINENLREDVGEPFPEEYGYHANMEVTMQDDLIFVREFQIHLDQDNEFPINATCLDEFLAMTDADFRDVYPDFFVLLPDTEESRRET